MSDTSLGTPPAAPNEPRSEAAVLADSRLRELLAGYQPLHHDLFLKGYARVLQELHQHGTRHEADLEYLLHQHDKEAYRQLWAIQHQKLFDLECQWRAGQVAVPAARLTADFEDWHEYIEECRVVPPISPDELALFDAFLAQLTDPDELHPGNPTQNLWLHRRYPGLREDGETDLNAWTEFWDACRGSGYLRALPDLRGELEHRYERAAHRTGRRQRPADEPIDPRPQVPTYGPEYDNLVRELLRRFEPAVYLRQFEIKQQLSAYDTPDEFDDLALALERLQEAGPIVIPIEAHADWRHAVIAAANRHYLGQLRAALPRVYEDYCQRESLGISHAPPSEYKRYFERGGHFAYAEKTIRKGRRALGEPDDLNF